MRWTGPSLFFLFAVTSASLSKYSDEHCEKDNDVCKETARASALPESWREYLSKVDSANSSQLDDSGLASDCACYKKVWEEDLQPFPNISRELLEKTLSKNPHLIKYQIINGRVFRSKKECLFPFRCLGIEHFLLKLAESLPDLEIVVNTHDWPMIHRKFETEPLPLFSFSKTQDFYDISYPAWTFWAGGPAIQLYPSGLGRWDLLRPSLVAASDKYPWSSKLDQAFFRGSRTSAERDSLVLLSRQQPDLVDAKFTKNQAWKSTKDSLGQEPAEEVSLEEHCRYRYLFNFRGVAASFRFKHLFLCNSLVLHVGQEWTEFFYRVMTPWKHFVPVPSDANENDIRDLLLFFRAFPDVAQKIAYTGSAFIIEHLRMEDVDCYWRSLLKEYASRLDFVVKPDPGAVEIRNFD